jgi:hypothetical protein
MLHAGTGITETMLDLIGANPSAESFDGLRLLLQRTSLAVQNSDIRQRGTLEMHNHEGTVANPLMVAFARMPDHARAESLGIGPEDFVAEAAERRLHLSYCFALSSLSSLPLVRRRRQRITVSAGPDRA